MAAKLQKQIYFSKRRILKNSDECLFDLKEGTLETLFGAFYEAVSLYEREVIQTPPNVRPRGFEASLLNAKMIQCIMEILPNNSKFGKYKRFIVRLSGYIFLFKKLNSKSLPMNIKTSHSSLLENQLQGRLFDSNDDGSEPILYFGYQKDRFGDIVNPKLVYIDEGKVKWEITNKEIDSSKKTHSISDIPSVTTTRKVALREGSRKIASGE